MAEHITVGIFPGAQMTPLYLAQQRGWFAEAGLDVTLHAVRSSTEQLSGWDEGKFAVIHTAPDHFIRGQRKVPGWMARREALGELVVVVNGEVPADPDDALWGVDAPDSAFAFVLRALLEQKTGKAPALATLVPKGGPPQRLEAVIKGEVLGATLNVPYDIIALNMGLTRLGGHGDIYPDMASGVCVLTRSLGATDAGRRYLQVRDRAMVETLAMGEAAFADILVERGSEPDIAAQTARALSGPFGLKVEPELTRENLQPVVEMRQRFDPGWQPDEDLIADLLTAP